MTPHTLLLIPSPGDPHGLLREGPCGARPPVVYEHVTWGDGLDPWRTYPPWGGAMHGDEPVLLRTALVLVWRDQVLGYGWDWAARAAEEVLTGVASLCGPSLVGTPHESARTLARILDCTVVALDAQGREVAGTGGGAGTGPGEKP